MVHSRLYLRLGSLRWGRVSGIRSGAVQFWTIGCVAKSSAHALGLTYLMCTRRCGECLLPLFSAWFNQSFNMVLDEVHEQLEPEPPRLHTLHLHTPDAPASTNTMTRSHGRAGRVMGRASSPRWRST